ncbi:MAG: hypothetical protein NTV30_07540 [Chloroflexi bacterium]|nr:hypothetical protein [Chloroflexota bacterium]
MREVLTILRKDLKESLRSKAFYFTVLIAVILPVVLTSVIRGQITTLTEEGMLTAIDILHLRNLIGTAVYLSNFMSMMLLSINSNGYVVTMEKIKRSLESLLCTPLEMKHVWIGKSLAIFIPCMVLGLLFAVGTISVINIFYIEPVLGYWIIPQTASLVSVFVAVPLIIFAFSSILVILQLLITNIRAISAISMIIVVGIFTGLSYSASITQSWLSMYVTLGVAVVLGLLTILLSTRLSRERIVLSSKV